VITNTPCSFTVSCPRRTSYSLKHMANLLIRGAVSLSEFSSLDAPTCGEGRSYGLKRLARLVAALLPGDVNVDGISE
jgi:hypothetical protein